MNNKDQMSLKPRLGRAIHMFGTNWYESRGKVLTSMGIDHGSRPEIYQKWRAWLKNARTEINNGVIAEKTGMSTGMISTDASKMGLTAPENDKHLIPPIQTTFQQDPYLIASQQFSYDRKTGEVKWIGVRGRLSLNRIGTVVFGNVMCKKRNLSYRQLVWLLHKKRMANGNLTLIDNDAPVVFSNLAEITTERVKGHVDRAAVQEVVTIFGRDRVLSVDSSKPKQPKSTSNAKRMSGYCHNEGTCQRYDICMDRMFECACIGYRKP